MAWLGYPILEGEATNRVIRLAEAAGVAVYIVHLSARDALEAVMAARDRGAMAFAETCPQYLFLSIDDLGTGSKARSSSARRRSGPGITRNPLEGASARTPSSLSQRTTARSTSTARRT